jgi:predicted nucleic acid-binding protein
MPIEAVIDASVAAKVFITEEGSDAARAFAVSGVRLLAPDLLLIELASVAAKRMTRGDIPRTLAEAMVAAAPGLPHELVPSAGLTSRAFALAADHGLSAYDSLYLALAEQRGCDLVTADLKLIARVAAAALPLVARAP